MKKKEKKEYELTLTKHILYVAFLVIFMWVMAWCSSDTMNPLLFLLVLSPIIITLPVTAVLVEEEQQKKKEKENK